MTIDNKEAMLTSGTLALNLDHDSHSDEKISTRVIDLYVNELLDMWKVKIIIFAKEHGFRQSEDSSSDKLVNLINNWRNVLLITADLRKHLSF